VNAAGGHHDFVGAADRDAVLRAHLLRDEIEQARHAGGLEVVSAVLGDRARHRVLDRIGRVETDVALIEAERLVDGVHHVADANDAGERNGVEKRAHVKRNHIKRVKG